MRKLITIMALLILIGSPAAIAQTGNSGGSSTAVKNPARCRKPRSATASRAPATFPRRRT